MSDQKIHLFEDFALDVTRGSLLRGDEPVHLRPQTYEVLKYLVEHRGQLMSKDKLIDDVWQGRAVTDGSLGKCIEELRGALGDAAMTRVRNVRGRGYIFDPGTNGTGKNDIASVDSEQIDVLRVTVVDEVHSGAGSVANQMRKRKLSLAVALTVLLLAVVALGYWFFVRRAANSTKIDSVAVMPFLNESSDPDTEYLSQGISESLINNLSRLAELKVIARSSSFKYKSNFDPQKVAGELGVQGLVTGRVSRHGDNLLISVELMDARDKTQVWGEQYNSRGSDLAVVQAEISREIARNLRLRLSAGEQQRLSRSNSVNPQAYDLLIRGRFLWRKEDQESRKKAVEYFREAIAVDPSYALAYADLSAGYEVLYAWSWLDPKEYRPKAEAAAQKALELDDGLADAHYAMANLRRSAWDWGVAEREYQRAIELNPNLAEAHSSYAYYLMDVGRYEEAVTEAKRARELDPLSLFKHVHVANMLVAARRYDEATDILHKTLGMDPKFAQTYFCFGFMYDMKGMYAEAVEAFQETVRLGHDSPGTQIYLGAAYAKAGAGDKARQMLKRLETSQDYVSPAELAVLYTALDQREEALASLEKAYTAHDLQLQFLNVDPSYDRLRGDPRFRDLVRLVGLPSK